MMSDTKKVQFAVQRIYVLQVVQYTYSSRNVTFLLVVLEGLEFEMTFLSANQRRNLNEPHLLSDKNHTKSVTIIVKSLRDSADLYRVANKKLLHELFVANRHNTSIDSFIFARFETHTVTHFSFQRDVSFFTSLLRSC